MLEMLPLPLAQHNSAETWMLEHVRDAMVRSVDAKTLSHNSVTVSPSASMRDKRGNMW